MAIYKNENGQAVKYSGSGIIDAALSSTSQNPVQNKVIAQELSKKADRIFYDEENNKLKLMSGDTILSEVKIECKGTDTQMVRFDDSSATWEQINSMLEDYYNNKITLDDIKTYWAIGDKRTISLSAMSATGVGESHSEQDVELVILDFDHDELTTPINGHTKAAVTLQLKNCLNKPGYMDGSHVYGSNWTSCDRRTWCNNVFKSALPSDLQSIIKTVNKSTSNDGSETSTINITSDDCFLASEIEVFGSTFNSGSGEGTQYPYYTISSNRVKTKSNDSTSWWVRSPNSSDVTYFCYVSNDGSSSKVSGGGGNFGISPTFCI